MTIPSTINGLPVTSIGDHAFDGRISLTGITIPSGVTNIGVRTFQSCSNLTSVTIPNSVITVGDAAFFRCASLTNVTIGNGVTRIGQSVFERTSLTSITIPDSVTSIGIAAFYLCTSLTNVTIGNSVTNIGDYAFSYCSSLRNVTIGNSVTSIEHDAFFSCTSLTSVIIPNSVTSIGDWAFASCTSLASVSIPSSVTSIASGTFSACFSLTNLTIPNSVTSIGDYAFTSCTSLSGIYFQGNAPGLGLSVFNNTDNVTVFYLPWTTGWGPTFGGRPTALYYPDSYIDGDGDGLNDYDEFFVYGTDPLKTDTDSDGMPDGWEVQHGLNPLVNDASGDLDLDGVTNLQEYQNRALGYRPDRASSFGDDRSDYERLFGTQTNRFYYDRTDRLVGADYNRGSNGFAIAYVYDGNGNLLRQKNLARDANHNRLPDVWEFLNGLTNNAGTYADTDGDAWTDYQEWKAGSNPMDSNSVSSLICVPPPAGLVAWWPGEENANDIQGSNNGTLMNGATFTAGKVGQAFSFDGVDDYVVVPDSEAQRPATITIEGWFKPLQVPNAGQDFTWVAKYAGWAGWYVYLSDTRTPTFVLHRQPEQTNAYAESSVSIPLGQWTHLACTYDGTNSKIYVNGALQGTASFPGGYTPTSIPMTIGKASHYDGGFAQEQVDEFSIYNRALTETEIDSIYAAGSAGKCKPVCVSKPAGIVAWWSGEGNANDVEGTNNGTLMNGATFTAGKVGQAFSFDGVDDYVVVPDSEAQRPTTITIEGWFKVLQVPSTNQLFRLVSKYAGGAGWILQVNHSLIPAFAVHQQSNSTGIYLDSSVPIPIGQWTHLACTYGGTDSKIYVNGALRGSGSFPGGYTPGTFPLRIGMASWGDTNTFASAQADEFSIYNRALTETEIDSIYAAGSAGKCTFGPQVVLQTAPLARVLPSPASGGNLANVRVRLWDAEGNAALPLLQFSPDTTNWFDVTNILTVDGAAYSLATRVQVLPTGSERVLVWNAGAVFPPGVTNIFLRARAKDVSLLGNWSEPMPYQLTITLDSDGDGLPDDWEMAAFANLNQGPLGDFDGDGFNNIHEYLAGTNPTDPNSSLKLRIEQLPGAVRLSWEGGSNAAQVLQQSFAVPFGWQDIFTNPASASAAITNILSGTYSFYQLRLGP